MQNFLENYARECERATLENAPEMIIVRFLKSYFFHCSHLQTRLESPESERLVLVRKYT